MKRSLLIIIAAILLICLSGCQALEINRAINEAADRQIIISNAGDLATAINTYNALNPDDAFPDDVTLEKVKEALEKEDIWPLCLHNESDVQKAWEFIVIKNGEAKVKGEG